MYSDLTHTQESIHREALQNTRNNHLYLYYQLPLCTLRSEPPEKSRPQYTGEETAFPLEVGALCNCLLLQKYTNLIA